MRFLLTMAALAVMPAVLRAQAPRPPHFFYGNLHAHTAYSDGNQDAMTSGVSTPAQSFVFAYASQHFDFLGISEHNHTSAGFDISRWPLLHQQADAATVDGTFVALAGMEFGIISNGGHVLVYGADELFGWQTGQFQQFVGQHDYHGLWRQVNRRPGCFASCAHPSNSDYNDLRNGPFDAAADSALVGSAFRSGPAFSTSLTYTDPASSSYESYYRALLTRGYHVGPFYDHDNHNTTFGRTTEGRLVVQADTLTRPALLQALRARHFYASDDWNTQVTLTLTAGQTYAMGDVAQEPGTPTVALTYADADAESVRSITLLAGRPGSGTQPVTVATGGAGAAAVQYTDLGLAYGDSAYYYAVVVQADNDKIITAPVWYKRGPLVVQPTGVVPALAAGPVAVWPNPAASNSAVTVAAPAGAALIVRDALGRVVWQLATTAAEATVLPLTEWAPGVYTVQVVLPTAGSVVQRLLVE